MSIDKFGRYLRSDNHIDGNSFTDISVFVSKAYLHKKLNDFKNVSNEILQKIPPLDISNLIRQITNLNKKIKEIQKQYEKKIGEMDITIKTFEEQKKKRERQHINQTPIKGVLIFKFLGTQADREFSADTYYTLPYGNGVTEYNFPLKEAKIIKVVADDEAYLVINKREFSPNRLLGYTLFENDQMLLTTNYSRFKFEKNIEIMVEYSYFSN